jgi:hypothetical protein
MHSQTINWWHAAMTSPLGLGSAALTLTLAVAAVGLTAMLWRAGRPVRARRDGRGLTVDVDGTATIEFTLVVPILLFIALTLAQASMLMGGNLIVHYAAFAAARSAVVQIPYDYPGEPANTYNSAAGGPKREAIFRTAVYALAPVGGDASNGAAGGALAASGSYTGALDSFYSGMGMASPPWISRLIGQRLSYAAANTDIALLRADDSGDIHLSTEITGGPVDPRDPLTVRVDHKLNLGVPYANRFFSDGGEGSWRYLNVSAYATLSSEGILEKLPPTPTIPRVP